MQILTIFTADDTIQLISITFVLCVIWLAVKIDNNNNRNQNKF